MERFGMTTVSSDAVRARDLIGYGRHRPRVEWPNGAALALSLVVNYEEGSEAYEHRGAPSTDGLAELNWYLPKDYRDFAMESVYEYGSRAGIWRLLDMFDEYQIPVTFFATPVALELNPAVGAAIQLAGHEPCSHGYRWDEAWRMSKEAEREQIQLAIDSIRSTTGSRPVGWYWRYSSSQWTRELLAEEGGFLYDSESYNDDLPYFTTAAGRPHLVLPYTHTYNDVHFVGAEGSHGSPADFVDSVVRGIDELRREGHRGFPKMMSVGLHPRWIGEANRASALREIIEHALSCGDVWIARREDIARWWIEHHQKWRT